MNTVKLETLVMDLAFAIEDPCGVDELRLAKAAIELVRHVPAMHRPNVATILEQMLKLKALKPVGT